MIAYQHGIGGAASALLRFISACARFSHGATSWQSPFQTNLRGNFHKLLLPANTERREIESKMVAIEQLRGDPKAMAAMLSDSIVRIARTRDEASFEVLFRHFAPRLKSYFLRQCSDHSLAEEITQEALVLVWRNAAQFDPSKASASTWIFTIARNLSVDRFRRTRRPTFDPTDPAFIPDGEQSPDYQLERAETDHRVREVMDTLSANEKSVLMLSFYEDCSHGDIAKKLDLPIGTVKSRIRLAFAKVRAALDARKGDAE